MKLFNSLSRRLEDFAPLSGNKVGVYFCGPTVYGFVHIGNLRAAMVNDLLVRSLRALGYEVTSVVNITDVDDKIIRALPGSGKTLGKFTGEYTEAYLSDLSTLGIRHADIMPRATEHIGEMVELIEMLLARGHAYKTTGGDVYFKVDSCDGYGELVNLDRSQLKTNADGRLSSVDEYGKDNVQDFALWKAYDPADGEVFWETTLGKGRPGWHIECSAMSTKYLGRTLDIHAGGVDLMFPHHTNEIAQSECGYGCKFAKFWVHNAHLMVNGKKMSKSLGNFFTLRELLDKGHSPIAMRYELLKTHYRDTLDFREDNFTANLAVVRKFQDFAADLKRASDSGETSAVKPDPIYQQFLAALADDLNIQAALTVVHDFVSRTRGRGELAPADALVALKTIEQFDSVLGLFFASGKPNELPADLKALFDERVTARRNKDFKRSDELRDALLARGVAVKDSKEGHAWSWV
jgi:cysteinyl-tRNA synthetase